MRKILLALAVICGATSLLNAQTIINENAKRFNGSVKTFRGDDVVCPGDPHDHFSIVPPPEFVSSIKKARMAQTVKRSQFIVNYVGFPEDAKAAFQRAVEIWEYLVYSTVPIRVTANWTSLAANVLGSANTSRWLMDFDGAKFVNTYYPIALAEKLAGKPLNSDLEDDIFCNFNSSMRWHYGSAESIPSGTYDFTTIVLHELGHGLGFISTMTASNMEGSYGDGESLKSVYDIYLENEKGENLVDTTFYKNNSLNLYNTLVSNNLYFEKSGQDDRPKIYAPATYSRGSSISHLDDNSYPHGTQNALMTSTARSQEVTHNPGPLAMGVLYKMGWKGTSIMHTRLKNINKSDLQPIVFRTNIISDTTLVPNSARVIYQTSAGQGTAPLINVPGTTEYTAQVTFPASVTEVRYLFEVSDHFGETVRNPGTDGVNPAEYIYSFKIADDVSGPVMISSALGIEEVSTPKHFYVLVDDDFEGQAVVQLNYQINNGTLQTIAMEKYDAAKHGLGLSQGSNDVYLYISLNAIPGLKTGDQVKYQFVGTDRVGNKTVLPTEYTSTNTSTPPVSSFFEFTTTSLLASVNNYNSDFESTGDDFAKVGFRVGTEANFNGRALHSSHPYKNGQGLLDPAGSGVVMDFERNEIAMLRSPIILGRGTSKTITFDEVVLVEPGERGAVFGGPGFYDYVVVEGLLVNSAGSEWFPLEDGYDSRAQNIWEQQFNANMSGGNAPNSTTAGSTIFTKKRVIDLNNSGLGNMFNIPLLIRFRLYSDELSNGWGWSIDNLYIQEEAPIILSNEENTQAGLKVYPNPAVGDYLGLEMSLSEPQKVNIEVFAIGGGKVIQENVDSKTSSLHYSLSVNALPSGTYVVKVSESKGAAFKRFVKL